MATVIDASDPAGKGRVRVMFSWQSIPQTDGEIDFDKENIEKLLSQIKK